MPEAAADLIFWIALACCAIAQIAILRSVLLVIPREAAGDGLPSSRRMAEVAWAILPAVVLAVVFWATWRVMHTHRLGADVVAMLSR